MPEGEGERETFLLPQNRCYTIGLFLGFHADPRDGMNGLFYNSAGFERRVFIFVDLGHRFFHDVSIVGV